MPKVKVPWLCSRSQPGIKVIIMDLRGHLLHTVSCLNSRKIFPTKEMHSITLIILHVKNWPQISKRINQLLKSEI